MLTSDTMKSNGLGLLHRVFSTHSFVWDVSGLQSYYATIDMDWNMHLRSLTSTTTPFKQIALYTQETGHISRVEMGVLCPSPSLIYQSPQVLGFSHWYGLSGLLAPPHLPLHEFWLYTCTPTTCLVVKHMDIISNFLRCMYKQLYDFTYIMMICM